MVQTEIYTDRTFLQLHHKTGVRHHSTATMSIRWPSTRACRLDATPQSNTNITLLDSRIHGCAKKFQPWCGYWLPKAFQWQMETKNPILKKVQPLYKADARNGETHILYLPASLNNLRQVTSIWRLTDPSTANLTWRSALHRKLPMPNHNPNTHDDFTFWNVGNRCFITKSTPWDILWWAII